MMDYEPSELVDWLSRHELFITKERFVLCGGEWTEDAERIPKGAFVKVKMEDRGSTDIREIVDGGVTVHFNQCFCIGALSTGAHLPIYDASYVDEHIRPLTDEEKQKIVQRHRDKLDQERAEIEKKWDLLRGK